MKISELKRIEKAATEAPWTWYIHDYSMATLCSDGNPIEKPIMDVGPCKSCADKSKKHHEKWKWGRCLTPKEDNARFITTARNHFPALMKVAAAGQAVLYHDERGQGIGYAEAMNALSEGLRELEDAK